MSRFRLLQEVIKTIEFAYDDAIEAASNPLLYDMMQDDGSEECGPLEFQNRIKTAIEFRKKLAIEAIKEGRS